MVDENWIKLEGQMSEAQGAMAETALKLLEAGINPTFVVHAAFNQVVVKVCIHRLDVEESLKVCQMLQDFIDDTKLSISECRN